MSNAHIRKQIQKFESRIWRQRSDAKRKQYRAWVSWYKSKLAPEPTVVNALGSGRTRRIA